MSPEEWSRTHFAESHMSTWGVVRSEMEDRLGAPNTCSGESWFAVRTLVGNMAAMGTTRPNDLLDP